MSANCGRIRPIECNSAAPAQAPCVAPEAEICVCSRLRRRAEALRHWRDHRTYLRRGRPPSGGLLLRGVFPGAETLGWFGRSLLMRRGGIPQGGRMTAADTEALIRRYCDAFNRGGIDGMLECVTDDVIHDVNQGERREGKKGSFPLFPP